VGKCTPVRDLRDGGRRAAEPLPPARPDPRTRDAGAGSEKSQGVLPAPRLLVRRGDGFVVGGRRQTATGMWVRRKLAHAIVSRTSLNVILTAGAMVL